MHYTAYVTKIITQIGKDPRDRMCYGMHNTYQGASLEALFDAISEDLGVAVDAFVVSDLERCVYVDRTENGYGEIPSGEDIYENAHGRTPLYQTSYKLDIEKSGEVEVEELLRFFNPDDADSDARWAIVGQQQDAGLFWSNTQGWVAYGDHDVFTDAEHKTLRLPLGKVS